MEAASKTLARHRGAIAKRMATAWDAAEEAGDKRKLEGLREFASLYDSAFGDIGEISNFIEVIELHTDEPGKEEEEVWVGEEEEEEDIWVAPTATEKTEAEDTVVVRSTSAESTSDEAMGLRQLPDEILEQMIAMLNDNPLQAQYIRERNRRKEG